MEQVTLTMELTPSLVPHSEAQGSPGSRKCTLQGERSGVASLSRWYSSAQSNMCEMRSYQSPPLGSLLGYTPCTSWAMCLWLGLRSSVRAWLWQSDGCQEDWEIQVSQQSQWIVSLIRSLGAVWPEMLLPPSLAPCSKLGRRQLLPSANDVIPEEFIIVPGMGKPEDMGGAELAWLETPARPSGVQ